MKKYLCWLILLITFKPCFSQSIIVNTPDSIFYLNQGSLCAFSWAGPYCGVSGVYSTAIYKDILYILTTNSSLYRMKVGDPTSCALLTRFPVHDPFGAGRSTVNSMTADKDGIIYTADGVTGDIIRYNPYTNAMQNLGRVGVSPGGDMMFYKNKLLLATVASGLYEVNLANPAASQQYMPADGHNFYGLISVPFDCTKNKYYGLEITGSTETSLYELDLANRVVGPLACTLPKQIYDGASTVDDGNTIGVGIDSIYVQAPCGNGSVGNVQFVAHSETDGPLTYVLDGNVTNNTGVFTDLPEGPHTVTITNLIGCVKDSSIVLKHGLTQVAISLVDPMSCDRQDGTISINATSGYPLMYSIDGGNFQTDPVFTNVNQGNHTIKIRDNGGCERDTTVFLSYQVRPVYFSSLSTLPTTCEGSTGSIVINLVPGVDPRDVTVKLFNGPAQPPSPLQNLDAGYYPVSLFYQNSCRFDTIVLIEKITNERPAIDIQVTDQHCIADNGTVAFSISGAHDPYLVNFNGSGYKANTNYPGLKPGTYAINIEDKNQCIFDTVVIVKPYVLTPWAKSVEKTNPTCTQPYSGTIMINVLGDQFPYFIEYKNRIYPSGSVIDNLTRGNYNLSILNKDNCEIDTVNVSLTIKQEPECDFIFVPTAFTPNKDGLNDIFIPYLGVGIDDFQFSIYNRWGQLVYVSTTRETGWNGNVSGKAQPSGVYAWVLSYRTETNPAKKLIKGTFTLIR